MAAAGADTDPAAAAPAVSTCAHCQREIPSSNIDLHSVHCARNLQKCQHCGEMVPRKLMDEHYDENHAPVCLQASKYDVVMSYSYNIIPYCFSLYGTKYVSMFMLSMLAHSIVISPSLFKIYLNIICLKLEVVGCYVWLHNLSYLQNAGD